VTRKVAHDRLGQGRDYQAHGSIKQVHDADDPAAAAGSSSADEADDLSVVGKAVQRTLGEDQLAVDGNLEDAAAPGDELAVSLERLLQLGRQTDGAGLVISLTAVFDLDPHRHSTLHTVERVLHPTKAARL